MHYSSAEIAEIMDWSHSAVKKSLQTLGIKKTTTAPSVAPYGYKIVDDELVVKSSEYKIVKKIIKLREQGLSFYKICHALDQSKAETRFGKAWNKTTVHRIYERETNNINMR